MVEEQQGEVIIGVDIDSKGFEKGSGDIEKAMKSLEATLTKAVSDMSNSISQTLTAALKQVDQQVQSTEKAVSKAGTKSGGQSSGGKAKYTDEYKEIEDFVKQQESNLQKLKEKQQEYNNLQIPQNMQYPHELKEKDNPLGSASDYRTIGEQIKDYEDTIRDCNEHLAELEASGRKYTLSLSQEMKNAAAEVSGIDFSALDLSQYDASVKRYAINVNKANLAYAQQENQLRQLEAQLAMLSQKEQTPEVIQKSDETQAKIDALKIKLQDLKQRAEEARLALERALKGGGETGGNTDKGSKGENDKSDENAITAFLGQLTNLGPVGGAAVTLIAKGFSKIRSGIQKATKKLNVFNQGQKMAKTLAKKTARQFTRIFTMLKSRIVRSFVTSLFSGISEGIQGIAKIDSGFNKVISTLKSRFSQLKFAIVSAFSPIISYIAPVLNRAMQYLTNLADRAGQLFAALTGQNYYKKAVYNYKDYAKSLEKNKNKTDKLTDSTKKLNKQLASFDELNVLNQIEENEDEEQTDELVYTNVPVSFEISNLSERIKAAFAKGDFREIGEELARRLNGTIDKIDPVSLGEKIARIINSAASFGAGFLETVEFDKLTLKVTDFLNTAISNINAEQVGELLSALLNAVIDIGFTFGTNFDFVQFGEKLGQCVQTILENTDWEKAGQALNSILIGLLDGVLAFLDEIDPDTVEDSVGDLVKGIDLGKIAVRLGKIIWRVLKLAWAVVKGLWNTSGILDWWKSEGEAFGWFLGKVFAKVKEKAKPFLDWFKGFANDIIGFINGIISGAASGLNRIIEIINGLSWEIPDWVPYIGGSTWGFNIPQIDAPQLPYLATGTVIPANYGEFAAILGDNKRDPEIVSPIPAMKQAFLEALAESGLLGGGSGDIVIEIDGREVFRAVKKENDTQKRRHGGVSLLA